MDAKEFYKFMASLAVVVLFVAAAIVIYKFTNSIAVTIISEIIMFTIIAGIVGGKGE